MQRLPRARRARGAARVRDRRGDAGVRRGAPRRPRLRTASWFGSCGSEAARMTTREGQHGWLVIYHPRGAFVARTDSPAAVQARKLGTMMSRTYSTLEMAYTKLSH